MIEIANSNMIEALRLVSVQRGFDPREFALVAFGGAGPLHANAIAHELGIPEVIIPLSPGVSSALGLLLADIKHDFVRTYIKRPGPGRPRLRQPRASPSSRPSPRPPRSGGCPRRKPALPPRARHAALRPVVRAEGRARPGHDRRFPTSKRAGAFHELHALTYGHGFPGEPVEIVNLRLTAQGVIPKPRMRRVKEAGNRAASAEQALKGDRSSVSRPPTDSSRHRSMTATPSKPAPAWPDPPS